MKKKSVNTTPLKLHQNQLNSIKILDEFVCPDNVSI
jgi:hypothetical protein